MLLTTESSFQPHFFFFQYTVNHRSLENFLFLEEALSQLVKALTFVLVIEHILSVEDVIDKKCWVSDVI